jgi:hypothetical protein
MTRMYIQHCDAESAAVMRDACRLMYDARITPGRLRRRVGPRSLGVMRAPRITLHGAGSFLPIPAPHRPGIQWPVGHLADRKSVDVGMKVGQGRHAS